MRDLNSRTFDRTGRRQPDRSAVRLLCPKAQRTLAWRSCWFRHSMWCRRRRPRRRPRELERVLGVRCYRTHHPMTPRRTPPVKTRRRMMKIPPPSRGRQGKESRPNWGGRRVQEGKDSPSGQLYHRRRRRRQVAAQGQAPGEVVSIRIQV